jgi:hypothetical protein
LFGYWLREKDRVFLLLCQDSFTKTEITQAAQQEAKREKEPKMQVVVFCGEHARKVRLANGDIKPQATRQMAMTDLMFSIVGFIMVFSCGERIVFFCDCVKKKLI